MTTPTATSTSAPAGISFTIPAATLKALMLFTPVKDIRYYLRGVCVDLRTPGAPVLVATDGYRMISIDTGKAAGCELQDPDTLPGTCPAECLISSDLIKALKPGTRGSVRVTLSDMRSPEGKAMDGNPLPPKFHRVTLATIGGPEVSGAPIEAVYPDWRRVTPDTSKDILTPFEVRSVNLAYLTDAHTALQLLGVVSAKYSGLPMDMGAYVPTTGTLPTLDDLRTKGASAHGCPLTMPRTNGVQIVIMGLRT